MDDINIASTLNGMYTGLANQADARSRAGYYNSLSAMNQQNMPIQAQNAANQNVLSQQAIQRGQADIDAKQSDAADAALISSVAQKHTKWEPAQQPPPTPQSAGQSAPASVPPPTPSSSLGSIIPFDANSYRAQSTQPNASSLASIGSPATPAMTAQPNSLSGLAGQNNISTPGVSTSNRSQLLTQNGIDPSLISKGLLEPGNINLQGRPLISMGNNQVGSEYSVSFTQDGKEVLVPTIFDGKAHTPQEAWQHYLQTGQHMGKYDNPQDADAAAELIHQREYAPGGSLAQSPIQSGLNAGITVKPGVDPLPPIKSYPPLSPTGGPAILDHPGLQAVTGAHNNQDTSMAVGNNPTFNPVQSYTAKGPNGQIGQFSMDRAGIIQDFMDQGRGDLATGLVKQWTDADTQSEQTKQAAIIKQHSRLAGTIAAFESLPDSMKPDAYSAIINQTKSEGTNTAGILPDAYDPNDKVGMAQLKSFEAQASTMAEKEKAKMDDVVATVGRQKTSETARHDKADEWLTNQKNQIEAAKAAQAASIGGIGNGLVGPAFRATLTPQQDNALSGVAIGLFKLPPRGAQTSQALMAAHQAFPDIDIPGAQKFTESLGNTSITSAGGLVNASNRMLGHTALMKDSDAKGADMNGGGILPNWAVSPINAASNTMSQSGGNAEAAWNTEHAKAVAEMTKSFKGAAGAESEQARDLKDLKFSDIPSRKDAVYQAYADLMHTQVNTIESQRANLYKNLDPGTSLLTPEGRASYIKLKGTDSGLLPMPGTIPGSKPMGNGNGGPGQNPGAANAPVANVAPIGTRVTMKDGTTKTKTVNGWE